MSRRLILLGGGMAVLAAAAAAAKPRRHEDIIGANRLADVIPYRVGSWTAIDAEGPSTPDDTSVTEVYDQVLTRTFGSASAPPVMVAIAYGAAQSGLMKLHRPDVCYDTAGFRVFDAFNVALRVSNGATIAARRFHATRGERDEHVLYWTRVGTAFPTDLDSQRIFMFEEGLRGVIPDGVLVRMSTLGPDDAAAQRLLQQFAQAFVESSSPMGRALLVGAVSGSKAAQRA